MRVLAVTPSRL
jgi:OmpA-OmpF porin, OOP family